MAKKTGTATLDDPQRAQGSLSPAVPFEQAMGELEQIVRQMESGSLSLEDSLLAYKRGVALVASCRDSLTSARQQVKILEGDLLKPFEVEQEIDANGDED